MAKKKNPFVDVDSFVDIDDNEEVTEENKDENNGGNEMTPSVVSENVNINNDIDINAILNDDYESKKSDKELVGIYFEPVVKKALSKYQKDKGRGAKSDFVNDIVKWALHQKGLL